MFLQILVEFRVDFGDIWVPGGVSRALLAVFGCPWGDLGRPVSICDGFRVTCGGSSGPLLGPLWHIRQPFDMIFGDFL